MTSHKTHTCHIAEAKCREGDNCETAWYLAGTTETSWKNTTTPQEELTPTNNSRTPQQPQRPPGDRLLQFTFLCVETCCSQQKDVLAEEHESHWAFTRTQMITHAHTLAEAGSQEAAITLHAGMSASSGQTHTHTRRLSLMERRDFAHTHTHTSVSSGEDEEEKKCGHLPHKEMWIRVRKQQTEREKRQTGGTGCRASRSEGERVVGLLPRVSCQVRKCAATERWRGREEGG